MSTGSTRGQLDPMEFHTDKDAGQAEHVLRIDGVGPVVRLGVALLVLWGAEAAADAQFQPTRNPGRQSAPYTRAGGHRGTPNFGPHHVNYRCPLQRGFDADRRLARFFFLGGARS